ncbi:MAG: hypothetical protein DYG92_06105 [Leptolyngbya sp. PLA1]|nr:hypothetical protein [Leptolyngbya sp. PLA1]
MSESLDSAPPLKQRSASPRSITRRLSPSESSELASAHVMVLDGPSQPWMIVTWHASMFGRYLSIHSGGRLSMPPLGVKSEVATVPQCRNEKPSPCAPPGSSPTAVACAAASSRVSAEINPAPMWHPIRDASYEGVRSGVSACDRVTSPASSTATLAAPTASSMSRAITFTALR